MAMQQIVAKIIENSMTNGIANTNNILFIITVTPNLYKYEFYSMCTLIEHSLKLPRTCINI